MTVSKSQQHRTIFLSDLHLGARGARADRVLDFLRRNEAATIYLVGDVFDSWQPLTHRWTETESAVIRLILDRARSGQRVVYTPGNHDAMFRRHFGIFFDCIEIADETIHETADGRRMLVVHGDACDRFLRRAAWLMRLGAQADGMVRGINHLINKALRGLGRAEITGIERTLARVNRSLRYGERYEERLVVLARDRQADGIVCGHFHQAGLHDEFGLTYANCGDWFDSCTAIVEDFSGRLSLVHWGQRQAVAVPQPGPAPILADVEEAKILA